MFPSSPDRIRQVLALLSPVPVPIHRLCPGISIPLVPKRKGKIQCQCGILYQIGFEREFSESQPFCKSTQHMKKSRAHKKGGTLACFPTKFWILGSVPTFPWRYIHMTRIWASEAWLSLLPKLLFSTEMKVSISTLPCTFGQLVPASICKGQLASTVPMSEVRVKKKQNSCHSFWSSDEGNCDFT